MWKFEKTTKMNDNWKDTKQKSILAYKTEEYNKHHRK